MCSEIMTGRPAHKHCATATAKFSSSEVKTRARALTSPPFHFHRRDPKTGFACPHRGPPPVERLVGDFIEPVPAMSKRTVG